MGCKSDIFGFGTSNMISRKNIMPVLASFKNLDIFSLSATLTHNGSSVPGSNHSQSLTDSNFAALWPTDPIFTALKVLDL